LSSDIRAELERLSHAALIDLIDRHARDDDRFKAWLAAQLAIQTSLNEGAGLDPAPFEARIAALLAPPFVGFRGGFRHDTLSEVDYEALDELVAQANTLLTAKDGVSALAILIPLARGLTEVAGNCDERDGCFEDLLAILNERIAVAVLLESVTQESCDDACDSLSRCQHEIAKYSDSGAFELAIAAASRRWDDPGLEDLLAGRGSIWPLIGSSDDDEERLTAARLSALDVMDRHQEFLRFSCAAKHFPAHAGMLVRLDRIEDAMAVARTHLRAPEDVLGLAKAVWDTGRCDAALDLGGWGLSMPRDPDTAAHTSAHAWLTLCRWVRDQAALAGQPAKAVSAAIGAFETSLAREDFRAAAKICEPHQWDTVREELLGRLIAAAYAVDRIDILLDEGRLDAAIASIEHANPRLHYARDEALVRLTNAALKARPEWAAGFAVKMASPIIESGRSSRYDLAAFWLERAACGFITLGRTAEWHHYLDELMTTHRRKHRLMGFLRSLRSRS